MSEAEIAAKVAENIPRPVEASVPIQEPLQAVPQDHTPVEHGLDELTQYKLCDVFDERYDPKNPELNTRLTYIYEEVSKIADSTDYVTVVAKIRSLMQAAGIAHSPNRVKRLNEWLRLRNVANDAFTGMENLRG